MILLLSLSLLFATEDGPFLVAGDTVPDFELKILDTDSTITLSKLAKKQEYTMLIFWTTFCPECLASLADCHNLTATFKSLKWDILPVTINYDRDKWDIVKGFIKKEKLDMPVLVDMKGDIAYEYGADMYNISFFIVDKNMTVVWSYPDHPDVPKQAKNEIIGSIKEALYTQ